MDPVTVIGLASSIISVIQLTGALLTLTQGYIGAVRSAPKDIEELQRSLQEFSQFLKDLDDRVKKNPQLISLTKLNGENGLLGRCYEELEQLRSKLDKPERLRSFRWPLKAAEVFQFTVKLEGYKNSLHLALGSDHLSVTQEIHEAVQSGFAEQVACREDNKARRQKKEALRAEGENSASLHWLYSEPTNTKHIEISDKRQPGTGDWFLRSPEFKEFVKGKPKASLLWAHGVPGAGKTFISSLVIDHLKGQEPTGWGIAFIYFDYKDQRQYRHSVVLASLIKQLASQVSQMPSKIEELHDILKKEARSASFEELYTILLAILASFSRTFLVFDALDECEPDDQGKLLLLFQRMKKDGFDIFLTSRPYPGDIQLSLAHAAKIEILANEEDIRVYIREKLNEHPQAEALFRKARCAVNDLTSDLMACTQGMFLLVRFYMGELLQQTTASQIWITLEELKKSTARQGSGPLDFIYERAMKTIHGQPENRKDLAIKALSWLVKAKRTLSFCEIQHAISVKQQKYKFDDLDSSLPDKMMLLDVCAGLVNVDENTGTVRFVHYTAQEFLLKDSKLLGDANFNVAMACITYLSFDVFAEGACATQEASRSRTELYPFLEYAVEHLSFHLGTCDEKLSTNMVLEFLERSGSIGSYWQLHKNSFPFDTTDTLYSDITRLHVASQIGHSLTVEALLKNGADLWATDRFGRTSLHFAAEQGHEAVVQVLIQLRVGQGFHAVIHLLAKDEVNCSNISHGIMRQRRSVVRGLRGFISARCNGGMTALWLAVRNGQEAVGQRLIAAGSDMSARGLYHRTALHEAASAGSQKLVQKLIAAGADISVRDIYKQTALHLAASAGSLEAVQQLISAGADISVRHKDGKTALHMAAQAGSQEVVHQLIAVGTDISVRDSDGQTPLHMAARAGSQEVVQQLIAASADISSRDEDGRTALHLAASAGRKGVVQQLTAAGADISAQDKDGQTALHMAAWAGSQEVVHQLIAAGTDISVRDSDGQTPLHMAARAGSQEVVQHLIAAGADISGRDKDGRTALHKAALRGDLISLQWLIALGADISVRDNDGQTALHKAALRGSLISLRGLIALGADISVRDNDGQTALHKAALRGSLISFRGLIALGSDISVLHNDVRTALHQVVLCGSQKEVQQLITTGADIPGRGNDGRTASHKAARAGSQEVVQQLIVTGTDISIRDKFGKTARKKHQNRVARTVRALLST